MKRKSKSSNSTKNGSSFKASRDKRRKSKSQVLPNKSTAENNSYASHSQPENDSSEKTTRAIAARTVISQSELAAAVQGSEQKNAGKTTTTTEKSNNKQRGTSKQTESAKNKANGEKSNSRSSNRRRTKSPDPELMRTAHRRSSRRSDGDAALVSLSYKYPGRMDWDSFNNCWVKKETAVNGDVLKATAVRLESSAPSKGKKKSAEKKKVSSAQKKREPPPRSKVVEFKDDEPPQLLNKDSNNKNMQLKQSPLAKETEKEPSVAKKEIPHQFDDADETDSVEVQSNKAESKSDKESALAVDGRSSGKDEKKIQSKEEEKAQLKAEEKVQPKPVPKTTIVVNPADVNVNDFCFVCRLDGDLMECFAELETGEEIGCGRSIHIGCIGRSQIPSGDWLCSRCARSQGLQIDEGRHPEYGFAFGEDHFEVESGGVSHNLSVGSRIAIFWEDDNQFYNATISARKGGNHVEVLYDDGVREGLDLSAEKIEVLPKDVKSVGSSDRTKSGDEDRKIALLDKNDIVCGRGDSQTNWAKQYGYFEFRKILDLYHAEYERLASTPERRTLCKTVYSVLESMGLRFVSWDGNGWNTLPYSKNVDKVNQGLRDFRVGSVDENQVDERGLRWKDIPLGYSTKKGLAYRPGYQLLKKIVVSMMGDFQAANDKRDVCVKVLAELEKENVRIVRIVKKDDRDDWVRVQKDKAIIRIMRAFREENGAVAPVTMMRSQGIMPSQQMAIPPLVDPKTNGNQARNRSKNRSRKSLPSSGTFSMDDRHPLLRVDSGSRRVSVEIDPEFLVQSDIDADTSTSGDDSSLSSLDSTMNQIEFFNEDLGEVTIKPSLVSLCFKIREGHLGREERPASHCFEPAIKNESANYYYQPPPLQRRLKLSYQNDMICDLIYPGPGKPPKQAAAHPSQHNSHSSILSSRDIASSDATARSDSKLTKKRKGAKQNTAKAAKRQRVTKPVVTPPQTTNIRKSIKQPIAVTKPVSQPIQRPNGSSNIATARLPLTNKVSLVPIKTPTILATNHKQGLTVPTASNPLLTIPTKLNNLSSPQKAVRLPRKQRAVTTVPTKLNNLVPPQKKVAQVPRQQKVAQLPLPTKLNNLIPPQSAAPLGWPSPLSQSASPILGASRVNKIKVVPHHLDLAAPKQKTIKAKHSPHVNAAGLLGIQDAAVAAAGKKIHNEQPSSVRFRNYQVEIWTTRLHEVQEFRRKHGHCIIPHDYPENQELARWAKRQRYQYQLYKNNSGKSYMTKERVQVLEQLGFCWEHKSSVWFHRYNELKVFVKEHGHTLVPTGYLKNRKLATWVKCQRRQMRLRENGEPHSMTDERIELLNKIHFAWQVNLSDPPSVTWPMVAKLQQQLLEDSDGDYYNGDDHNHDGDNDDDVVLALLLKPNSSLKPARTSLMKKTKAAKKEEIPGLIKGLGDTEIGEEERRIRAKYKGIVLGEENCEALEDETRIKTTTQTPNTFNRKRNSRDPSEPSGIGKIRAKSSPNKKSKFRVKKSVGGVGEEERKIRAKYSKKSKPSPTKTPTATTAVDGIGEEERKIRAKYGYKGNNNTVTIDEGNEAETNESIGDDDDPYSVLEQMILGKYASYNNGSSTEEIGEEERKIRAKYKKEEEERNKTSNSSII